MQRPTLQSEHDNATTPISHAPPTPHNTPAFVPLAPIVSGSTTLEGDLEMTNAPLMVPLSIPTQGCLLSTNMDGVVGTSFNTQAANMAPADTSSASIPTPSKPVLDSTNGTQLVADIDMSDVEPAKTIPMPPHDSGLGCVPVGQTTGANQGQIPPTAHRAVPLNATAGGEVHLTKRKRGDCTPIPVAVETVAVRELPAPASFFLSGPTFQSQLHKELILFVKKADGLVSLQPWFTTFQMSNQSTDTWAAVVAGSLEHTHFQPCTSGADSGFREAYFQLMSWYARCEASPVVSEYQAWIEDYTLPYLLEHLSKTLSPSPIEGVFLPFAERKNALYKLFVAIARANLRMVLLRAQGSCTTTRLTKEGTWTLPPDLPASWEVLKKMAVDMERTRALQLKNQALNDHSRVRYQELIDSGVSLFEEKHLSLSRKIISYNAESAQSTEERHQRWASKDAFLADAHHQNRLVEDDGVIMLVYKLRRMILAPILDKLEPIKRDTKKRILSGRRRFVLHDLFVRLHLAHSQWRATHGKSILQGFPNPDQQLQGCVRTLEWRIVDYVEAHPPTHRTPTEIYIDKASAMIEAVIDDPLEALKTAVQDSFGKYVSLAMDVRKYARNSPQGPPEEIEEKHAPTGFNMLTEPGAKRGCSYDVREVRSERPQFQLADGRSGCVLWKDKDGDEEME